MPPASRRSLVQCCFALVLGAALSGCAINTDVSGPSALIKTSGDQQSAPINTTLPNALVVTVITQFGEPIRNSSITWTIVSGGGALSGFTTVTDDVGNAHATYTTGSTAGQALIKASTTNGLFTNFGVTITSS